jgi:hypothetical protein
MSERKTIFLNGAPFWYPLSGSVISLATSVITHSIAGLPFVLQCISGLVLIANLSMLMSCWSTFGRWLGRTKCPDVVMLFSGLVSLIDLGALPDTHMTPSLDIFITGAIFLMTFITLAFSALALLTLFSDSYYLEDSEGQMVSLPNCRPPNSGDRLMQRKLFGSSLVRVVNSHLKLESRATRMERLFAQAIGVPYDLVSVEKG